MSPSRNVIVKIEKTPKIGDTVVNEKLKPIGKISDVFGPVSSPYATVKTTLREPEKLTNKMLYVLPSKRRKEKIK
jgi:rRNA processing protein Gar1